MDTETQVISFHCIMKDRLGRVLSSSYNHEVINQRVFGSERLSGLVEGLQSVEPGERRLISVLANRAFGSYDPSLVLELRRSELEYGDQLVPGAQVLRRVAGTAEDRLFRVVRLQGDTVVLDGNHPLAGHDLVFEVEIVSVRPARQEDFMDEFLPKVSRTFH